MVEFLAVSPCAWLRPRNLHFDPCSRFGHLYLTGPLAYAAGLAVCFGLGTRGRFCDALAFDSLRIVNCRH